MFTAIGLAIGILFACLVFGLVMEKICPTYSRLNPITIDRIVARNKGFVLHNESYRNGNEYYVLPRYQNVSANAVSLAVRNSHGKFNCYQKADFGH